MKRVKPTYSIIFLLISFILTSKNISAQIDFKDENRNVYWFYVSVIQVEDSTGHAYYKLKRKRKRIYNGVIKEFDRNLWKYIGNGSKIAIGPFNNLIDAEKAFFLYGVNEKAQLIDSIFNNSQDVYWINFYVVRGRRTNYPIRKPSSIEYGNYKSFKKNLEKNLMIRVMTIGPFINKQEAEKAKDRYRLY